MNKLTEFQMTRFANNVRFVFINLHIDYSAVRLALVNVIDSKENGSAFKDRRKAEEAEYVLRKINSCFFYLSLSGCTDIYNYMVSFLTSAKKLIFSHTSGWAEFKM